MMQVNLSGLFYCCQAVLPLMQTQDYGRILNIGSILSLRGLEGASCYSASKGAINGLSKAIAKYVRKCNIFINTLALGAIEDTGLAVDLKKKYGSQIVEELFSETLCNSEEVVKFAKLLCSNHIQFTSGQVFVLGKNLSQ
jgi:NAD(P)-dependent dehydrogenase (short-subunit alcohol dehydrogenase family)